MLLENKTVFITGGAQRIGACIVETLHAQGANIILHFRSSRKSAENLAHKLNSVRPDSVKLIQADLVQSKTLSSLCEQALDLFKRIDYLINNASTFYPTPVGQITEENWSDLIDINLKAPLFLSQALTPALRDQQGAIINIVDIHAERPMTNHTVYCCAKAGLAMLTKSLAKELAPDIRVNGIAPGAILWPENELDETTKSVILNRTFLKKPGTPADIADTALFLLAQSPYITGQIIAVDGGRNQFM